MDTVRPLGSIDGQIGIKLQGQGPEKFEVFPIAPAPFVLPLHLPEHTWTRSEPLPEGEGPNRYSDPS